MTNTMHRGFLFILLSAMMLTFSCQHAKAGESPAAPENVQPPALPLTITPGVDCFPELSVTPPTEAAQTPMGKAVIQWALPAEKDTDIPETTYTLYRQFKRNGNRGRYESPYFQKRTLLTQEVMRAWLTQDDARMDRINDLIWAICEETTWVMPAHESGNDYIDLFAAETGTTLAHIVRLLGERLPEEVRRRIEQEVKTRILDPYLAKGSQYQWNSGRNNWTGVCAGSVGECFLLLEKDPERLNNALALVCGQLQRYIEKGFAPDGVSLEGIGYWNYGLSHYVSFAEMLHAATNGAIDLLDNGKVRAIARYPLSVSLGNGLFASFSDGEEHSLMMSFLCARLAERAGVPELRTLPGDTGDWVIGNVLRNVLWNPSPKISDVEMKTIFLPESGIVRYVGSIAGGTPLVLAAKAGGNDEPHNHNDIGSFILCVDGTIYLCDPGGGLYNRDYFSSKRYENVFANSYGHSVPRIGGTLQMQGSKYHGAIEMPDARSIRIGFAGGYELPSLKEAVRNVRLDGENIAFEDSYAFEGSGLPVEEAFITWLNVETDGPVARVISPRGVLEIRADQGVFATERLEDACRANQMSATLTRITLSYPEAATISARFTMVYHPAPSAETR